MEKATEQDSTVDVLRGVAMTFGCFRRFLQNKIVDN